MKQLAHTKSKTIDVALDAGYGSHSSFTKSFTKETGLSPKEFRNNVGDKHLRSHMKHTEIPFLGYEEVKPQKIIYVRKTGNYQISASQAWDALARTLEANGFFSTDGEYFGISHDDPHAEDIQ